MGVFDHIRFLPLDQGEPETVADRVTNKLVDLGWNELDNVILNAGTGFVADPAEEPVETIRQTLDVNLAANIAIAHAVYPHLKASRRGKLSIIGSTARKGAGNFASYAASKAALHGLARALKEEWRGKVKVQAIHPGPTKTDMHEKAGLKLGAARNFFADPDAMAKMIETQIAARRFTSNLGLLHYWGGAQYSRWTLK
jgi:short-subunit dehydrogenase